MIFLLCYGLLAGCAGIPVAKKDSKPGRAYLAVKVIFQPNMCGYGVNPTDGGTLEPAPGIANTQQSIVFESRNDTAGKAKKT